MDSLSCLFFSRHIIRIFSSAIDIRFGNHQHHILSRYMQYGVKPDTCPETDIEEEADESGSSPGRQRQ
jgi:hypothetical protein